VYSRNLFPVIPEQYGGGSPKRILLIMKRRRKGQEPVRLWHDSGDEYLIETAKGEVFHLRKRELAGVQVMPTEGP
jgi:hypothetical protein